MSLKRNGLWILYAVFAFTAVYFHQGESLFVSHGAYPAGKILVWFMLIGFLVYSIYCSRKENIFKTIKTISLLHWGRQIGIDLYLGVGITMFLIYLNEGTLWVLAIWFIPLILFANLASLLYLALNYDAIVSHFL